MTITVDISGEVRAEIERQAANRGMDVPAYVSGLLEQAARPESPALQDKTARPKRPRPAGRKSLVELFAESPLRGLDLDFERDRDAGRDIEL